MSTNYEERRKKAQAAAPKDNKAKVIAAAALVALLVVAGVVWAVVANRKDSAKVDQAIAGASQPKNATKDGGGILANPGKAKPGAPVLAVYEDFQCPVCKHVEDAVGPTVTKMADEGKITLEYHLRTFLDTNIERAMPQVPNRSSSLRASAAASCADQVGAFKAYHDAVFKGQPAQEGDGYTDQQLRETFAQQAGITGDKLATFQSCVDGGSMKGYATKMEKVGGEQGNTGTPEYRLNGKAIDFRTFYQDPTQLEKAVAAATK